MRPLSIVSPEADLFEQAPEVGEIAVDIGYHKDAPVRGQNRVPDLRRARPERADGGSFHRHAQSSFSITSSREETPSDSPTVRKPYSS